MTHQTLRLGKCWKLFWATLNAPGWRQHCESKVSCPGTQGPCLFCAPLDRHIGQHIDQNLTDVLADISTNARPMCQLTYRPTLCQYIDQDVSVNISTDISAECQYVDREATEIPPILHCYLITTVFLDNDWICGTWSDHKVYRNFWGWPKKNMSIAASVGCWYVDRYISRGVHKIHMIRTQYNPMPETRGPFLERPGNLTGPKSYFEIKV